MRPKLIEDWLPIGQIAGVMSERRTKGEPAGIHHWWGTRPSALARAVLFASLVDTPDDDDAPTWRRVYDAMAGVIDDEAMLRPWIESLVRESNPDGLPPFLDPCAGVGTFPHAALRLGMRATAADLNPVACLIAKAALAKDRVKLAETVCREDRVTARVREQVAALYSDADAFIWMHTAPDPNPAFGGAEVPLSVSFALSRTQWLRPVVEDGHAGSATPPAGGTRSDASAPHWRFEVCEGAVPEEFAHGTRISPSTFKSVLSGAVMSREYIQEQAAQGLLRRRMVAVVKTDAKGKRRYSIPTEAELARADASVDFTIDTPYPDCAHRFTPILYGGKTFDTLHLPRQKKALALIAGAIAEEARATGAKEKALVHGLALSSLASWMTASCSWCAAGECARNLYVHQCIPMAWEFCEYNPFGRHTKTWAAMLKGVCEALAALPATEAGEVLCRDARDALGENRYLVSTEVPYHDLVATADLSDFFYYWQRRALKDAYPELFQGIATPKEGELTALAHRRGGRAPADAHYRKGLLAALASVRREARGDYPVTLWYEFKSVTLTGRDAVPFVAFVEAVCAAGLRITATWPVCDGRKMTAFGKKSPDLFAALVFVCRPKESAGKTTMRRAFLRELRANLPGELRRLKELLGVTGPEFAPAAVGVGLRRYTAYDAILSADGSRLGVAETVDEILKVVDEIASDERAAAAVADPTDVRADVLRRLREGAAPEQVRARVSAACEKAQASGRLAEAEALNQVLNDWNTLIEEKDNESMA